MIMLLQVASHAQKYFIRLASSNRRKRRTSLFDIVNEPACLDSNDKLEKNVRSLMLDSDFDTYCQGKKEHYVEFTYVLSLCLRHRRMKTRERPSLDKRLHHL